jgi:hypothetical protein
MPKRSNDFQRLVYLVRLNLADGAKVTESKLMRDRLTKRFREVDVVIEGHVGQQPVVVSIECRDHKRVADVTWIDTMKAKHERLNTHALLLASRMGFTPEARDVAAKYGIELFTLENIDTAGVPAILRPNSSIWFKSISVTAQKVTARVSQVSNLAVETVATSPDNLLYLEDGSELCQVMELVESLLKSDGPQTYLLLEAKEEHVWYDFAWEPPADHLGRALYMKKIDPEAFRAIECLRIVGPCKVEIERFGMRQGRLGDVKVAWGKSSIAGRETLAVATVTQAGETKLSINFSKK